jgi:hypothetical protein
LSGLNALGVQQLLAASSQNSLANTQGKKKKNKEAAGPGKDQYFYSNSIDVVSLFLST